MASLLDFSARLQHCFLRDLQLLVCMSSGLSWIALISFPHICDSSLGNRWVAVAKLMMHHTPVAVKHACQDMNDLCTGGCFPYSH
jgi:hypothetical protein